MKEILIDELNNVVFLLRSHSHLKALKYIDKAISLLSNTPEQAVDNALKEDYSRTVSSLRETISLLKRCVSSSRPGDINSCKNVAHEVYRQSLILYIIGTGEIKRVVKARRVSYLALALGLPTSALFGLNPLALGLIFMGTLWTYLYFVRLKLIGWIVLVSSLMLILPFLINASIYFIHALLSPDEVSYIASALGLEYVYALILVSTLFIISIVSLALDLYSMSLLFKYRDIFK